MNDDDNPAENHQDATQEPQPGGDVFVPLTRLQARKCAAIIADAAAAASQDGHRPALEDVRDFLHALAAENFLHALAAEDDQTPTRPSPAARAWKRVSAWPWPATESPTTRPARP